MGVRKEGGRKARALALVLSLFLLSSLLVWQGKPTRAATYTDTTDSDFAQGIHENTENVGGDLRLKWGSTSGKFISRSFQAPASLFRWGTLSWDAILPLKNAYVGLEPDPLRDGSSKVGRVVEGSLLNTRLLDGVYEDIAEQAGFSSGPENLILFWDGDTIPPGWTCISDDPGEPFYYRFPRGGSVYGLQGGSETHTHTFTYTISGPNQYTGGDSGNDVTAANATHTHTCTITVSTENHLPPFYTLKVIKYTGVPSTLPAGVIAIFTTTSLPPGWSPYTPADGRFARGGPAVGSGGSLTHSHSVGVSTGGPSGTTGLNTSIFADSKSYSTSTHTHSGSGTSGPANNLPPYTTVVLAKATTDVPIPGGMIGMFDGIPSGNWELLSGPGGVLENKFLLENLTTGFGLTGGAETHTHPDLPITTSQDATSSARITSGTTQYAIAHTHTVTVSFSPASHLPPYTTIIFAKALCGLRWQHTIENISTSYSSYQLLVKGYTTGDSENVKVYVWKKSTGSWEYLGGLTTTEATLSKAFTSPELSSYLDGTNLYVKYESLDNTDTVITTLKVDLCILTEGDPSLTYVKFRVQVSSNGSTWSVEMGPDGTSNTYFTISPASLENIPENNYIRYVAYLSSENPQLTGPSGPLVHEVTIQSIDAGRGWICTQDAKDVSWNSAILTARVLYSDPTVVVRFQYRKAGSEVWENTPWEGCESKVYWRRITGLENDTAYEFQAQLYSKAEDKIENGGIRTFRTLHPTPVATPLRVTLVDNGSAVLSARIYYADKDSVTLKFWYGSGGSWNSTSPVTVWTTTYSCPIPSLSLATTYEWKVEIAGENFVGENFVTFGSKYTGMGYSGDLGAGSLPGWHGVRVENLPAGAKGMKLELLTSSPSPLYHSVRVVRENGELLYAGSFLSDNGRTKLVSLRFWKTAAAGENVYVELYDPVGFAFRGRGTDSSMPFTRSGIKYSYSYLDRTGKNLRYYDRACGLQVLEVYT